MRAELNEAGWSGSGGEVVTRRKWAMVEINTSLFVHGCQLEVHRRAQADGTERTVIVVQRVERALESHTAGGMP